MPVRGAAVERMVEDESGAKAGRRHGGRSARVRAAVLAAAVEELKENGYENLSITAVAARADVSHTSIYRRWKTVNGLLAEARFALFSENIAIPDRGSLRGDLIAFLSAAGRFLQTPLGQAAIVSSVTTLGTTPYVREVHLLWSRRFAALHEVFRRAEDRNEWQVGADPQPVMEALIGAVYFRIFIMRQRVRRSDVCRVVDVFLNAERPRES